MRDSGAVTGVQFQFEAALKCYCCRLIASYYDRTQNVRDGYQADTRIARVGNAF